MKAIIAFISFLAIAALTITAKAQNRIKIDGSSTVYPITEAMAEEFQTLKRGAVKITAGISGTGGGFKKFCRGETDVQGASRPITKAEMQDCKKAGVQYIELPIAYDATVVAVNTKNPMNEITVEQLKKMWEPSAASKIKKWNQVVPSWPDADLKLFGAGSDSGTFDYFTEAIMGKAKSSRGDYTASEDDNIIVKGIAGDKNAIGYLPMSYYMENKKTLKALAIKVGSKAGVLPTTETVENGTYFPLSRPLFIYVNTGAAARPEVKEFVNFYLEQASAIVPSVKYVALPTKAYKTAAEHFAKGKIGTVFADGNHVGITIEDLLKKEASF